MSRSVCIGYFSKPEVDLEIGPSRDAAKAERLSTASSLSSFDPAESAAFKPLLGQVHLS
jgi:hypothetical protein